jgi:hypothetical protein
MKKTIVLCFLALCAPAFSQLITNPPANIVGSQGFNTNNTDTNRTSNYAFVFNDFDTNATFGYAFNSTNWDTNRTSGYSFSTNASTSNATTAYSFSVASPGSGQFSVQNLYEFYTFGVSAGTTNAVWLYQASNPTNGYSLITSNPMYVDNNVLNVRDPYICKWISNGVPVYILSYTAHNGNAFTSATPGPGVATSYNGTNFTFLGYANLTTNYFSQWSPKFCINSTNGLIATVGLSAGTPGAQPTNAAVFDVSINNLLTWSNPRLLPGQFNAGVAGNEPSAGVILYTNSLYYYFNSSADECTNSTLNPNTWGYLNIDNARWSHAGPVVFNFNGLWYWYTTDGGFRCITSPDLIHWTNNVFGGVNPTLTTFSPAAQEGVILPNVIITQRF